MNKEYEIAINNIKFEDIKKDVSEIAKGVPFGNSIFQNTQIIKNKEITRGRKIRALVLNLTSKIKILDELKISLERHSLKKRQKEIEKQDIIYPDMSERDSIEARLLELDIEKMNLDLSSISKQLNDTIVEVESIYAELKKLGSISREEFEKEEQEHFKLSIMKKQLIDYAQRLIDIGLGDDAYLSLNNSDSFMKKCDVDEKLFKRLGVTANEL
jgi:hypothetical protein